MSAPVENPRRSTKRATTQLQLSSSDRIELETLMRRGRTSARVFKRARVLQLLDQGLGPGLVCMAVGVSYTLVQRIGTRYRSSGLQVALHEAARPGVARRLKPEQEQRVLELVLAPPPPGHERWSVRLLTQQVLEQGLVARVGRETIRELLKRHRLQPWKRPTTLPAPRPPSTHVAPWATSGERTNRPAALTPDLGRVGIRWLAR